MDNNKTLKERLKRLDKDLVRLEDKAEEAMRELNNLKSGRENEGNAE